MLEILLIWCGLGVVAMFWYWYEISPLRRKRFLEYPLAVILWPLAAYSAWIWWRCRRRSVTEFRAQGIPHCPRHGYILLKCEEDHEAFCGGCVPQHRCPVCGKDAWSSPRFHGRSAAGEPIVIYERIYADPHEISQR